MPEVDEIKFLEQRKTMLQEEWNRAQAVNNFYIAQNKAKQLPIVAKQTSHRTSDEEKQLAELKQVAKELEDNKEALKAFYRAEIAKIDAKITPPSFLPSPNTAPTVPEKNQALISKQIKRMKKIQENWVKESRASMIIINTIMLEINSLNDSIAQDKERLKQTDGKRQLVEGFYQGKVEQLKIQEKSLEHQIKIYNQSLDDYNQRYEFEANKLEKLQNPIAKPLNYTESTGIEWETSSLYDVEFRVGRLNGEIVDVQAKLSDAQYQNLVSHFNNNSVNWKTSCFTYIFQNELAAYERERLDKTEYGYKAESKTDKDLGHLAKNLRMWTGTYAPFEEMINNMHEFTDPLGELIRRLQNQIKIIEKMEAADLKKKEDEIKIDPEIPKALKEGIKKFLAEAIQLRNQSPNEIEIRRFLSIQPETNRTCLGEFLCSQMLTMNTMATKQAYQIGSGGTFFGTIGYNFRQLFVKKHYLIEHLETAAAEIRSKGVALNGVATNNSRDPIDPGMVGSLVTQKNPRTNNHTYTSIMPYLAADLKSKDQLFKQLSPDRRVRKYEKDIKAGFFRQSLVVGANIAELGWGLFAFRGLAAGVMSLAYGVGKIAGIILHPTTAGREEYNKSLDAAFERGEKNISKFHEGLSSYIGVKGAKKVRSRLYSRELNMLEDPKSNFDDLANKVTGTKIGRFFSESIGGILSPLQYVANYAMDPEFREQKSQEAAMRKLKRTAPDKYKREVTLDFFKGARQNFEEIMKEKYQAQASVPKKQDEIVRAGVKPWERNEFSSTMEFFQEIFVGLADCIINPMFRHSPGWATVFFIMAHASFGVMTAPSMFTGAVFGSAKGTLLSVSKTIAMDFMGKHVVGKEATTFGNALTAFLEFKLPMIGVEVTQQSVGDGAFMRSALANPEQATLGLCVLVGLSTFLSHVPDMPLYLELPKEGLPSLDTIPGTQISNPIGSIMNSVIIEAAEVQEGGLYPLTTLEFGFLAFKLTVFAQNMVGTSRDPAEHENVLKAYDLLTPAVDELGNWKEFKNENDKTGQQKFIRDMREAYKAYLESRGYDLKKETDLNNPDLKLGNLSEDEQKNIIRTALKNNGIETGAFMEKMINGIQKELVVACDENKKNNIAVAQTKNQLIEVQKELTRKTLPSKREKLLGLVTSVEMWGNKPMTLEMANNTYDDLYNAFKAYNEEQRAKGHWDKIIDKNDFLEEFSNKFIQPHYKAGAFRAWVNSTAAWFTGNRLKDSSAAPHERSRVKRNLSADMTGLGMIAAMMFRPASVYATGTGNTLTGVLGLAITPFIMLYGAGKLLQGAYRRVFTAEGENAWSKTSKEAASTLTSINRVISFSPQNIEAPRALKTAQARNARETGVSSQHLETTVKNVKARLEKQGQEDTKILGWTKDYNRKFSEKTSNTSARRAEKNKLLVYSNAMQTLENRVTRLMGMIGEIEKYPKDPSNADVDLDYYKNLLKDIQAKLGEYRNNSGALNGNDVVMPQRIEYSENMMGKLDNEIESNIENILKDKKLNMLAMRVGVCTELIDDINKLKPNDKSINSILKQLKSLDDEEKPRKDDPEFEEDYQRKLAWVEKTRLELTQLRAELNMKKMSPTNIKINNNVPQATAVNNVTATSAESPSEKPLTWDDVLDPDQILNDQETGQAQVGNGNPNNSSNIVTAAPAPSINKNSPMVNSSELTNQPKNIQPKNMVSSPDDPNLISKPASQNNKLTLAEQVTNNLNNPDPHTIINPDNLRNSPVFAKPKSSLLDKEDQNIMDQIVETQSGLGNRDHNAAAATFVNGSHPSDNNTQDVHNGVHNKAAEKIKSTLEHNQFLRQLANQGEISEEMKQHLGSAEKVVAVIDLETPSKITIDGKDMKLENVTEIVENVEMFKDTKDLMDQLNANHVEMVLGSETFFIKGVLHNAENGQPMVVFVKCKSPNDDPKNAPFVDANDVAVYAKANSEHPSFSAAIATKVCEKVKSLNEHSEKFRNVAILNAEAHKELHNKIKIE